LRLSFNRRVKKSIESNPERLAPGLLLKDKLLLKIF